MFPLYNVHDLFLLFSFTSLRELLIYSSDVEIIFPFTYTYTHFVSTGVIYLIRFSQHSIVCVHSLHHRHNNRDRNVGMEHLLYICSYLFSIARNNFFNRCFLHYTDNNPSTAVQCCLQFFVYS